MSSLTPEQQLRVCELIWPNKRWCIRKGHVHLRLGRQAGVYIPDLTSHKAVGAMVAYLEAQGADEIRFSRDEASAIWRDRVEVVVDNFEAGKVCNLQWLVLEVGGDG